MLPRLSFSAFLSVSTVLLLLLIAPSACDGQGSNGDGVEVPQIGPAVPMTGPDAEAGTPISPVTGELNGGCAPDGVSGHQKKTCADEVIFDIDVPPRCLSSVCGIILDVHGWSMNGPMQALHTRLPELTRDKPYIVINPTGPIGIADKPSWGKGSNPYSTDFAFDATVWSFVEATQTRFHGDAKRIHITGFSQGAMMSFRLAFAHSDKVASIAPIAGPAGFADPSPVRGAKPTGKAPPNTIPILYMHGTKDRELNFEGNAKVVREEVIKGYALGAAEEIPQPATTVRAARYRPLAGGPAGAPPPVLFEFWEHDYSTDDGATVGGHCVPGPVEKGDGSIFGKPESVKPFRCVDKVQTLDAGKEVLRFFEEHPRP